MLEKYISADRYSLLAILPDFAYRNPTMVLTLISRAKAGMVLSSISLEKSISETDDIGVGLLRASLCGLKTRQAIKLARSIIIKSVLMRIPDMLPALKYNELFGPCMKCQKLLLPCSVKMNSSAGSSQTGKRGLNLESAQAL